MARGGWRCGRLGRGLLLRRLGRRGRRRRRRDRGRRRRAIERRLLIADRVTEHAGSQRDSGEQADEGGAVHDVT